MTQFLMNWCKIMFTQTKGAIRVRTGMSQEGTLSARRVVDFEEPEVVSTTSLFAKNPLVELEENTIYLNRREASFVNKEVSRLLKAKVAESKRKKKAGIPLPPEPGKVAYAVYQ